MRMEDFGKLLDGKLLDGDALGEVARLVDVAPAHVGDVVRHQLQRDDVEERH